VITQLEAESIAAGILGRPASDTARPWALLSFDYGWMIDKQAAEEIAGEAHWIIERADGRVLIFPSSVPPMRILREYSEVRSRGLEQDT
jgi:hypothetical protein